MATTRTTSAVRRERARTRVAVAGVLTLQRDTVSLLLASFVVICGLLLVYSARSGEFAVVNARLGRGEIVNLNRAPSVPQLERALSSLPAAADRRFAAEQLLLGIS